MEDGIEIKCSSPTFVAGCLEEYQLWRKGEGKYKEAMAKPPFSPKELTVIENAAARLLREMSEYIRGNR